MTLPKNVLFLALFMGFLGLLPHALYSVDIGSFSGMEYAWDEHTYANYALFRENETHRLFSSFLFKAIYLLCGKSFGLTMALADFAIPFFVAVLAACFVRACGFNGARQMFMAASFVLFSTAFLAFSDINFWGKFLRHISPFAMTGLTEKTGGIIPYTTVAFLPLFRSPDPQASMIVQMAVILALFCHARNPADRHIFWALAGLCLLFPFIYITQSIGLLVLLAGYGVLGFLGNRDRSALGVLVLALAGAVWTFFIFSLKTGDSYASSFIYASHMPVIGASVLWAIAGGGYIVWRKFKDIKHVFSPGFLTERQVFSLACFLVPVVTLNQQIITGLMIRPMSWELYANYTFTAAAILALWPDLPAFKGNGSLRWLRLTKAIPFVLALALVCNQGKSYGRFIERNLVSEASTSLILTLDNDGELKGKTILLGDPASEAGIRNRLGNDYALKIFPGHFSLLEKQQLIARAAERGYALADMPMKETGFLLRRYQGMTPDAFEKFMAGQVRQGLCEPVTQYFFWVRDCWGYLTDFRGLRRDKLQPVIAHLAKDYQGFLGDRARQDVFGPVVYLTTSKDRPDGMRLVQSSRAGWLMPVTVYAYIKSE